MNRKQALHRAPRGYVSYVMVLSMGVVMLMLLMSSYKTSIQSQKVQAGATLRIDYAAKEDAVLRAIVPIVANRAMLCMQDGSMSGSKQTPLRWQKIFRFAILEANAETSVSAAMLANMEVGDAIVANPGDNTTYASKTFSAYDLDGQYTSPGLNRDLGLGFPAPLQSSSGTVQTRDHVWPVISFDKVYGSLAEGRVGASTADFPQHNLIPYPNIRFGYAQPGQPFVAKRNWWAFSVDLSDHWDNETGLEDRARDFVLSIYEVPSQLAISAAAYTVLGQHADGSDWENTIISGGVFASRAKLGAGFSVERLAGRRGLEIDADATVGENGWRIEQDGVEGSPFAPGIREQYELGHNSFMPVSLASESGRAAFIPINRGIDFFDCYAHTSELNTISPTTWNDYSVGAMQCAMHLDITDVPDENNAIPSEMVLRYFKDGVRESLTIDLEQGLLSGFIHGVVENQTMEFDEPVDVAYGSDGQYFFEYGVTGSVTFDNTRFGDPIVGTFKAGYYRPSYPFEITMLHGSKPCVSLYPERIPAFLSSIGADDTEVNHSISINVDYPGNVFLDKPSIPCTDLDYGVILKECADMTGFSKGFSLVTNLRLYIADDFNTTEIPIPVGSGIEAPFYTPCSLFAPEKRYGAEYDPFKLKISGQMGSLAGDNGAAGHSVHLLDLKTASNGELDHDQIDVNLAAIKHPAALPPITLMNWLVVIEERHSEYYDGGEQAAN